MKRLVLILSILVMSVIVMAQAPQQFSYQALIRDAENEIISNRVITMQVSIITANGKVVYSETHQTATNENGVVSVAIGSGTTIDDFSQIDWSKGEYYLQTIIDLGVGEQLVSGNSPLLSVPYAFYAEKAGNAVEVDLSGYALKSEIPAEVDLTDYAKKSDIPESVDLSGYALKSEIPAEVDLTDYAKKSDIPEAVDLSGYALKSEIPAEVDLTDYAKKSDIPEAVDLSGYALKSEIPDEVDLTDYAKKSDIPEAVDLSGYALKSEIPAEIDLTDYAKKSDIPEAVDLSGYALKSEIPAEVDLTDYAKKSDIPEAVDLSEYALKSEIPAEVDLSNFYLKSDVDELLAELNAKIMKLIPLEGAIQFAFSVSENKQVYFSRDNLQYKVSSGTFRFAEHQYDTIGIDNKRYSSTSSGRIDLYCWGTSGYNGKKPEKKSTSTYDFGDGENDITGTNYDWGVYNAIFNGENQAGLWRTLTIDEWIYLIQTRTDASNKYGFAKVNNICGLVLLPDNWTLPNDLVFISGNNNFSKNIYSDEDWIKMENNGAVFLPAAGHYNVQNSSSGLIANVSGVNSYGYYWSSSANSTTYAVVLRFYKEVVETYDSYRDTGLSVRLVRDVTE